MFYPSAAQLYAHPDFPESRLLSIRPQGLCIYIMNKRDHVASLFVCVGATIQPSFLSFVGMGIEPAFLGGLFFGGGTTGRRPSACSCARWSGRFHFGSELHLHVCNLLRRSSLQSPPVFVHSIVPMPAIGQVALHHHRQHRHDVGVTHRTDLHLPVSCGKISLGDF